MPRALYGLPKKVVFCKKTLVSNQRPVSSVEFKNNKLQKKITTFIDCNGISDPWKFSRYKKKINWSKRENQLLKLLERYRSNNSNFDCIVPGSGGKDSCYAAHILKYKYGMNPLTVTWPPILYTKYGYQNYLNWIASGKFENVLPKRNKDTLRRLTKLSILNLMHPFQTFMMGQKYFPVRVAIKYKIPLVFYGENEAEHGNSYKDNFAPTRDLSYFYTAEKPENFYFGGVNLKKLVKKGMKINYLKEYFPIEKKEISSSTDLNVQYLGYYLNWIPQEAYYYAVKNCKFRPRPFRSEGTYSKYNSIDDKIDDLHYYTTFIKFGIGRTTYDVSQEIRNDHLSIEEGKILIKKYDGEIPTKYTSEVLEYLNIKKTYFFNLLDKFRSPHLWKRSKNNWYLRHTANKDGTDD
jgi:N-acetyl sugar amidotransferase